MNEVELKIQELENLPIQNEQLMEYVYRIKKYTNAVIDGVISLQEFDDLLQDFEDILANLTNEDLLLSETISQIKKDIKTELGS